MYAPPCSWRTGTKSIDERESDSLRSSVSSPGMPKTCLTPSASRHSTKTSDARRLATRREPTKAPVPRPRARRLPPMGDSPTRYAKSGDLHIAYQAAGEAPADIVYVPTWIGQLEIL